MFFLIASCIIGVAASLITIRTLVSYTTHKWWIKLSVAFVVLWGWFGHNAVWYFRHHSILPPFLYDIFAYISYIGLGFVFILLCLLVVRDFCWFVGYGVAKLAKSGYTEKLDPFNTYYLNIANIATVVLAVVLTSWGIYEAVKIPDVKEITIQSAKIKEPFKLVQINDLHINRTTPVASVKRLVEKVNSLKADAIAIVGDVVDEKQPEKIKKQMEVLTQLKAKYGRYTVFGNHDFYSGFFVWIKKFMELKMGLLINNGHSIIDKIYIAGIPDKSGEEMFPKLEINLSKALERNNKKLYTVLLSHTPNFTEEEVEGVDLQLSGHTHGGQIFPFHFLVKAANEYLAGLYEEDGRKIYVSRGTGYWGPPVRLFAPSEITVINLEPENK